ncbi:MAG TPA: rhodanese-like domain-containing protein [Armatimonadota bacterium]|jgi:rhodanese-related sulfurtransferase
MNIALLLLLLLPGSLSLTGCRPLPATGQPPTPAVTEAPPIPVYRKISAQEAKAHLDKDHTITLVDVRTEEEYREKRIANSILIPDYEIEGQAAKMLPKKDQTLFLYCRSGRRSRAAALKLVAMGYTNVYDFGGIIDWPYETVSGK